jgi:streptogramin lyase
MLRFPFDSDAYYKWVIIFILGLSIPSTAVASDWVSYADMNTANELLSYNGYVWGIAQGGAFAIDSNDSLVRRITNVEGLKGLELNTMEIDSSGNMWFGAENGTLNKFDSDGNYLTHYLIFEHPNVIDEPMAIYDITADGEWLWIARQEALSKFSIYDNGG